MTSRQRSERSGRETQADSADDEQPTVSLLTPDELAERRARERRRGLRRRLLGRRGEPAPAASPDPDERAERPPREWPTVTLAVSGAVAASYVALSLSDGGFASAIWAEATILVWWTVLMAVVARAWPRSGIPLAGVLTAVAILAFTILTGASIAWTSDLGAAWSDAMRGAGYLGVFILTAIAARAGAGRAFLAGLAFGLLAVCLVALLSRLEPGLIESRDEARGLRVSGGRLSWPLGYWNALGACAAAAVPLFVWLAISSRSAWGRALAAGAVPALVLTLFFTGSRAGLVAQAVALLVLLLAGPRRVTLLAVLALTLFSANVLVGAASGTPDLVNGEDSATAASAGDRLLVLTILAFAVVTAIVRFADRRIARLHLPVVGVRRATVALVAGVVVLLGLSSLTADPVERLKEFDDPPATAQATEAGSRIGGAGSSGRAQFWDAALTAFSNEPLHGIGAGGFESFWAVNGELDFTVTHAHSFFFEAAAELGILGPLLALAIFAIPAIAGVRRLRAPTSWAGSQTATGGVGAALAVLAAVGTVAAADWIWDLPAAFVPGIIAAAYLCVPPASRGPAPESPRPRRRRRRHARQHPRLRGAVAVGAVMCAGAAAIAASGATLLSERALSRSEAALAAGDAADAADEAREASDWLPFAAAPYRQLALAENARGRVPESRQAIDDAQALAAGDWELWFVEAGIEFSGDELPRGVYALNRAQGLNPKAPGGLFVAP